MSHDVVNIYINGIEIGSLPLALYQDVKRQVYRRPWLYLRQLVNVLRCFILAAGLMFRCLPLLWLALGVVVLLGDPAALATVIDLLRSASGVEVVNSMKQGFIMSLQFLSFVMMMFSIVFSHRFCRWVGFTNVFDNEINYRIRSLLDAPGEGDMSVYVASGTQHGQQ